MIQILLDAGVTQEQLNWGVYFVVGGSTCPYTSYSAAILNKNGVKNIQYISLPDGAHTIEAELEGGQAMPAYFTNFNMDVLKQTPSCITDAEAFALDPEFARMYNTTLKQGSGSLRQLGIYGGGYYGTDNGFWVCRGVGCTKKWGQRR